MQCLLMADEIDKLTVPSHSSYVHEAEWQGDPDMCSFQSRNPIEHKVLWCQIGAICFMHGGKLENKLFSGPIKMSCTTKCSDSVTSNAKR
jgi:hypothetical protein